MQIKKYNLMAVRLNNKLVMLKNFRCFGHLVHGNVEAFPVFDDEYSLGLHLHIFL